MSNTKTEASLPTFLYVANKNELRYHYVGKTGFETALANANLSLQGSSGTWHEFKVSIEKWLLEQQVPEVVFLDLPINREELVSLNELIIMNQIDASTVFIYNQAQITGDQQIVEGHKKLLSELYFLDDSINLHDGSTSLFEIITFLRKFKSISISDPLYKKVKSHFQQITAVENGLMLKRAFDFLFALFFLLLLAPIFLLIAISIKLDSRGPVFYSALRAGRRFQVFKFYKFRTMDVNADKKVEALSNLNQYDASHTGPKFFKISNDPRVTRLGKFLRNTSLDELPQLLNVLKGDMSIIGNRPLPLYEAETLTTDEHIERFNAPAGITGLWQIKKRGNENMSVEERIGLDIAYSRNINIVNDLRILVKTPLSMVQKANV